MNQQEQVESIKNSIEAAQTLIEDMLQPTSGITKEGIQMVVTYLRGAAAAATTLESNLRLGYEQK